MQYSLLIGDNDYIAFTTKSATKDNQKSRVIIPLVEALQYEEWLLAQRSLNDALEAYGIIADRCSERASQIAFLPNRGSYYDYHLKVNQKYFELVEPLVFAADGDAPETTYTHLYIRQPDPYRHHVGDIDFYLPQDEYDKLYSDLKSGKEITGARIFPSPHLDMIELHDPDSDVLVYISTHQMTEVVKNTKSGA